MYNICKGEVMTQYAYHATAHHNVIEQADISKAQSTRSDYGQGFYGAFHGEDCLDNSSIRSEGGFIYRYELPYEIDTFNVEHGENHFNGFADLDTEVIERIASAMETLEGQGEQDWIKEAEELRDDYDNGHYTVQNFVINIQRKYGCLSPENSSATTSNDIFKVARIDFMVSGGYIIHVSDRRPPRLIPDEYYSPHSRGDFSSSAAQVKDARAIGALLWPISQLNLEPDIERQMKIMAADATLATQNGDVESYSKFKAFRTVLEAASPSAIKLAERLDKAELQAGEAQGVIDDAVSLNKQATAIVNGRPARYEGEGFLEYKERIFDWYDAHYADRGENAESAFLERLRDALYIEAQNQYAKATMDALAITRDPQRMASMLASEQRYVANRDLLAVQHVEGEAGTLRNKQGFDYSAATIANPSQKPTQDQYTPKAF